MSSWQQQRQRMDSEDEDGEIEEEGEIVVAPAPGIGSGDASNIDGGSGSDSNNKNNSITTINAPPSNSAGGTLGSQQKAVAQPQSNNILSIYYCSLINGRLLSLPLFYYILPLFSLSKAIHYYY